MGCYLYYLQLLTRIKTKDGNGPWREVQERHNSANISRLAKLNRIEWLQRDGGESEEDGESGREIERQSDGDGDGEIGGQKAGGEDLRLPN